MLPDACWFIFTILSCSAFANAADHHMLHEADPDMQKFLQALEENKVGLAGKMQHTQVDIVMYCDRSFTCQ